MTTQTNILPSRSQSEHQLPTWKKLFVNFWDCLCLGAMGLSGGYKTQPDESILIK